MRRLRIILGDRRCTQHRHHERISLDLAPYLLLRPEEGRDDSRASTFVGRAKRIAKKVARKSVNACKSPLRVVY